MKTEAQCREQLESIRAKPKSKRSVREQACLSIFETYAIVYDPYDTHRGPGTDFSWSTHAAFYQGTPARLSVNATMKECIHEIVSCRAWFHRFENHEGAHLLGDYVLQNSWMATEKTKSSIPCLVHVLIYTLCFAALLRPSLAALAFIAVTHFFIDRFRLARYAVWAWEQVAPRKFQTSWSECRSTGYAPDKPIWLSFWMLIIIDNTLHLLLNHLALELL